MSSYLRVVTNQVEFNKAIAEKVAIIEIRSPQNTVIVVYACGSSTVYACGSSTVHAYDSSTVYAYGSSTVRACDSSTVHAYDSSTVYAYGSSTVRACDSSTVRACDSSTVYTCGSSTVRACDSSTVYACDSSTVRASPFVAVHVQSKRASIDGGVQINHVAIDLTDATVWCEYHGVTVIDGVATLYKAVNDAWTTDRGTDYAPGSLPSCDDFVKENYCGGGLHFGPTPHHALYYFLGATRFVEVGVLVDELQPITGDTAKAKAPRVVRACRQVDINGNPVSV